MDEKDALDLAKQFREHLRYTGDVEEFDLLVVDLVQCVTEECAKIVDEAPRIMLQLMNDPYTYLAYCIRGKDKR